MSRLSLSALLVAVSLGVASVNIPMYAHAFEPGTVDSAQAAKLAANPNFAALVQGALPGATVALGGLGAGLTGATIAAAAALLGVIVVVTAASNESDNFTVTGTTGTTGTIGTR